MQYVNSIPFILDCDGVPIYVGQRYSLAGGKNKLWVLKEVIMEGDKKVAICHYHKNEKETYRNYSYQIQA